jgi:transposase
VKVRDIVGLYLDPPAKAIVLCVDEKSQIQALDRTAPMLPLRPGLPERRTHDYVRHGTTTLFAALEVATGKVVDACYDRHRHQEFLRFLKQVAKAYPRRELHVVVDNYAAHKHPAVTTWLGKRPRITLHFTPTSGSWLNLVEVFFGILTRQAIRRGTFTSVADLEAAIGTYIDAWNDRCQPFTWTKDAGEEAVGLAAGLVVGVLTSFAVLWFGSLVQLRRRPRMFLSYRRSDSAVETAAIFGELSRRYGAAHVFMDVQTIRPGHDFRTEISRMLRRCDAVFVVIGRGWTSVTDDAGRRRLAETDDPIRIEVEMALRAVDMVVLPVLVGGAVLPRPEELPEDMRALAYRHAVVVDVDGGDIGRSLAGRCGSGESTLASWSGRCR